jgi:hypothetical protein
MALPPGFVFMVMIVELVNIIGPKIAASETCYFSRIGALPGACAFESPATLDL